MNTDKTTELKAAIEKAIERLEGNIMPCAFDVRKILTAAIAEPEKGPLTCPKCNNSLDNGRNSAIWVCDRHGCGYSQRDSAQRPKMPEPREGYHAGDCVIPVFGKHSAWFSADNKNRIVIHTWESGAMPEPHVYQGYRWIAVKDEPVPDHLDREIAREEYLNDSGRDEPAKVPVCQSENIVGRQCTLLSGHEGSHNVTDENGIVIALWNDPPPSPAKVPVVEYFSNLTCRSFCKVRNGIIIETFPDAPAWNGKELVRSSWENITPAEYEAARKPAFVETAVGEFQPAADVRDSRRKHLDGLAEGWEEEKAIEPMACAYSNFDYQEAIDKINELIERHTALEKRVAALEGREGLT